MLGEGVLNVGANTQNVGNLWKSHLLNTPHMDIKWVERLLGWNQHHILLRIRGGHRTRKCVQMFTLGWGHRTEFKVGCWLGGWLAGSMIIVPILAPSCKLKLARFSAKLRIQDGAECGKMGNCFCIWTLKNA